MGLRILHVINNLSRGGAEILLKNTINILTEDSHLIVLLEDQGELISEFNGKVSFISLTKHSKIRIRSIWKLRRIIRDWKPDIIHSHLFNATLIARLAKSPRVPLVSTVHSMYSVDAFRNLKALLLERFTSNMQDALITVSNTILADYLEYIKFRGKVYVIPNFLPQTYFQTNIQIKDKSTVFKCVAVGNLKAAKNYPLLLEAFRTLKDKEITLDIYGEGGLEQELQEYIRKHELNVVLRGPSNDLINILPKFDLFIQGSLHEGFGISVLEAMALKLPVLLSDIPVFREITNADAHFFPKDDATILAGIILDLNNNNQLRTSYIDKALSFISITNQENSYKSKLISVYESLRMKVE